MAVTNEFERDLINQAQLKHPGRIDMIAFQNIPDAGDGSPGIQRCFRNYLHEGGMEKDLELIGFGIKGTSFDIDNAELQQLGNIGASVITGSIWTQLSNIGAAVISSNEWSQIANIGASVTIDVTQWGYVGGADQPVKQADSPTFGGLALTGNLTIAGNSITGTSVNINNAEMQQLSNIGGVTIDGTQWGYLGALNQGLTQTSDITFNSLALTTTLTMSGNIIMGSDDITFTAGGLVDGVDVGSHNHSGAGEGGTVDHVNLSNKGSNTHAQIDTHITAYTTYTTAEHNREITPIYMIPEDGYTTGDNNVYYGGTYVFTTFGKNSYASAHYLYVNFKLPSDYVDGEDVTIKLNVANQSDVSTTYQIVCNRYRDGDGVGGSGLGTLSGAWVESTAGPFHDQTATITGTNLAGGDGIGLKMRLKSTDFPTDVAQIQKIVLVIPVNSRD